MTKVLAAAVACLLSAAALAQQSTGSSGSANPDLLYYQAHKLAGNKDYDGAIRGYSDVINLHPRDQLAAMAFNGRGLAYRQKGDFDKAISDYTQAIRLDPRSASVFANRANAYARTRNYDAAIRDYREALRLGDNDPVTKDNYEAVMRLKARSEARGGSDVR